MRDLGGLRTASGARTRRGVIYRADGLSRLSDADLERLAALNVRTIIDLRYDDERARAPDRLPPQAAPEVYVRGFMPRGSVEMFEGVNERGADADAAFTLMRDNYARIVLEHTAEFRDVLHHVVSPGRAPHLIHCTSGKDRTGIAVALILLAVGVSAEDVLDDYALSNVEWQPVDAFGPNARADAIEVVMAARPEYLEAALSSMAHEFGSVDAYLARALAFGDAEREALAALLLEPGDAARG